MESSEALQKLQQMKREFLNLHVELDLDDSSKDSEDYDQGVIDGKKIVSTKILKILRKFPEVDLF